MIDHPAPTAPLDAQTAFVYSCFRGSSTWFWSRLRAQRKLCCYYEILNEQLEYMVASDTSAPRPDSWPSHHPKVAPYFKEFLPLLGDNSGVPGFPKEQPLGSRFIGRHGIDGALDPDIAAYVASLIRHARASGRVPILTDPRLLARAAGCRSAFGGAHIMVVRNLFEQWVSICGQWRAGNDYFVRMVFNQLRHGRRDHFFALLWSRFTARDRQSFDDWARDENLDLVFACYVALCIYLLLHARRQCDLVVDITRLEDPGYRIAAEGDLGRLLGVRVKLADFERRVDYPRRLIQSPSGCRADMAGLVESALSTAGADADESVFAHALFDAVWRAQGEFMSYTSGAREILAAVHAGSLRDALDEARAKHAEESKSLRAALTESKRHVEALVVHHAQEAANAAAEVDALRKSLGESQAYAESLKAHVGSLEKALSESQAYVASLKMDSEAAHAYVDSLQARIARETAEAKAEREAMQASQREGAVYAVELENARRESEAHALSLEKAFAESQAFADALQARIEREAADARAEREAMRASQRESEAHALSLERALAESQAFAGSLQARIEREAADAKAEREAMQASQREAAAHAAALRKALEESQQHAGSLKEALEESRQYADSLRARLDREAAEANRERARLIADIAGWQARHAGMQRRFRLLKFLWPHETDNPKEPE